MEGFTLTNIEEELVLRKNELHLDEKTDLEALSGLSEAYLALGDHTNYLKYSKLYFQAKKHNH